MDPGSPLLALRLGEACHALEPGRDYLIGSADDCDLVIRDAEAVHVRVSVTEDTVTLTDLSEEAGILHNEERVTEAVLKAGDRIAIGFEFVVAVPDDGTAALVPIPAMRQAATARRIRRIRMQAAALRRYDGISFTALLAHEMRRTPWMAVSLALHMLLLLLLWWFTPESKIGGESIATLGFDVAAGAPMGDGPPAPPEVVTEPDDDVILEDPDQQVEEVPVPIVDGPSPDLTELAENPILATRRRTNNSGSSLAAIRDEGGVGSGSFQAELREVRESGLEIVFVFDSTGSMSRTIMDTKETIVQMLDVLRLLVPDARVGLVTFRDRNRREEYLVRQVPLDIDYWRASNFVQFVVAEGGGDKEEDVRAGLNAAFRQDWKSGKRRVVVLAGDAPTHERDEKRMLTEVRQFARRSNSYVHTLITNPEIAGEETEEQFERIAEAGRGSCESIENRDRILQRVLTLAFGPQYNDDMKQVVADANKSRNRVNVQALHLVRKGGDNLVRALKERPVTMELWNALTRRRRQHVAITLVDLLGDPRTKSHTRHACAAALQRILELAVPPVDPDSNEPPSKHYLGRLRSMARRLPK